MNVEVNVLLVEDSPADQFLFEAAIQDSGRNVELTKAQDGEEAKDLLASKRVQPRVIFLDINMPRMNGYEFLSSSEQILIAADTAVYMLSSSDQERDKELASTYPFVKGYIEKPCSPELLASILSV